MLGDEHSGLDRSPAENHLWLLFFCGGFSFHQNHPDTIVIVNNEMLNYIFFKINKCNE